MPFYMRTPVGPLAKAIRAQVASFTTRQDITGDPWPTLQPVDMEVGACFQIHADGYFSTVTAPNSTPGLALMTSPPTIATVLAEGSVSAVTATLWPFRMDLEMMITGVGSAGTCDVQGECAMGTSLTAWTPQPFPLTDALRTVTINTRVPNSIGVCWTFSVSSASNLVKVKRLYVERVG
jgi:hypothetical protein